MNSETNNSAPNGGAAREGQAARVGFGWLGEAAKIVLPSLITALIGFGIWNTQKDIEQKVEKNNRMIQTRLALSEEFYKRRLTVYEATCKEVATVKDALDQAQLDTGKAADSLASLDKFRRSNALYISDNLENSLSDLWGAGIDLMMNAEDDAVKQRIAERIARAHVHMKDELKVNELSKMLLESGDQLR